MFSTILFVGRKKNSIYISDLYIGNLCHIWKKVITPEAGKTLTIEVQNNMHFFNLLYRGYNKIIIIPVLKSENRNVYTPNHN